MKGGKRTLRLWLVLLSVVFSEVGLAETSPAEPPPEPSTVPAEPRRPWRAHEAVGLSWLHFGLEHRSRFEHLENDFRAANAGNATGFSMRTLLSAELRFLPFVVGAELEDSRIWASDTTPLNTTLVNPLELLQGYVGLRGEHWFVRGDTASLTAGRMTLDLGSRRFVARNGFRNTINAFTGLDLEWTSPAKDVLRAFAVMPVTRLPSDPEGLEGNRIEFDRENTDAVLWAAFFQSRPLADRITVEGYVLGLFEGDRAVATLNRQILTPGARGYAKPAAGAVDFELEAALQAGTSRASTAADDPENLAHRAFFARAQVGYSLDVFWSPRFVAEYDYASGDRDPEDGTNGRFDTLFGARRFDFGPTGVYGALARTNLSSPGLRAEVKPHTTVDAFVGYRFAWLASERDAWTTAGLQDPTGASGKFIGQQVEASVRWHPLPENVSLELGAAHFVRGEFAKQAPGSRAEPASYVYTQATFTL